MAQLIGAGSLDSNPHEIVRSPKGEHGINTPVYTNANFILRDGSLCQVTFKKYPNVFGRRQQRYKDEKDVNENKIINNALSWENKKEKFKNQGIKTSEDTGAKYGFAP